MAIEVEATGQVDEFLRVLKRRVWWIIVPFSLIGSVGVFFAVVVPKKYVADTEIMVMNLPDATSDTGEKVATIEGQAAPDNLRSLVRIASILESLGWDDFRALGSVQKETYVNDVRTDIKVELPSAKPNSERQKVVVTYKNIDPGKAKQFLGKLVGSWTKEVLRRNLQQEEKERVETAGQLGLLSRRLLEISARENEIRTDKGIPPPLQTARGREPQRHPAYDELTGIESSILAIEDEIDFESEGLEMMTEKRDLMLDHDNSADPGASTPAQREIADLNAQIARELLKIDDHRWGPKHSERELSERRIEALQKRRSSVQTRMGSTGFRAPSEKRNQKKVLLTEEIEDLGRELGRKQARLERYRLRAIDLQAKTAELNDASEELETLAGEKASLRGAVGTLRTRLANLEINVARLDSDEGDPFMELKAPTVSSRATSPNPYIIGIGSIIAGLGLGLALAILLEYSKNCFRSGRELRRVMPHPVLGTVNSIRTRRERARGLIVRTVMGGGSIAFVASVMFVTWTYAQDYEALNPSLAKAIEGFRRMLM